MQVDAESGIIFRENTFDGWIVNESRAYFPIGLRPTDVILDIGGHIGAFAARAMKECPEVVLSSIEAEKSNFDVLQQNAEKFNFDAVHGAMVDDPQDGQNIALYVNAKKNNATHSVLETRGRETQQTTGYGFKRILDNFTPTVIKCDIEGGEYILPWRQLAPHNQVRLVIMELHLTKKGHREKAQELLTVLREFGFTYTREPKIGEKNWTTLAVMKRGE